MLIGLSVKVWCVFWGVGVGDTRQTVKIFERENNLAFKGKSKSQAMLLGGVHQQKVSGIL